MDQPRGHVDDPAVRGPQCREGRGGHIIGRGVMIGGVKPDFATTDDYQASYLTTQAAKELCPSMIWQLRRSAADYQPPMS